MAEQRVALGEIVATHGLDGWLKFNPYNLDGDTLAPGLQIYLETSTGQAIHEIESSKPHKNQLLVKLRGIDHIDATKPVIGAILEVDSAALPELEPGQYYHYEVIGFDVVDRDGHRIGKLTATITTAAGDLYVVQGADKEHLIPAVKEMVDRVDFEGQKIIVDLPDGLLDL
ncbi:MAG: 16S rRNA processing protein RimM [Deltaproteobacteria bacterium]|nr:16S rRNA processing protein RimM [Deltaproteobacteria bacterium]